MPGFAYNGIHFVSWRSEEYASPESLTALDGLADTNANWAGLLTTWYQADAQAVQMSPVPDKTPSDEALRCAVERMHALGLRILLKPHVDALDETWRGEFQPPNPDEWFGNYGRLLAHYADWAQASRVDALVIGTEFVRLTGGRFRRRWMELISDVRTRFGGLLTYAANATHAKDEFSQVSFWDALDLIGLDAYFPVSQGWTPHAAGIQRMAEEFDKPVVFTEIGYRSVTDAGKEPWNWANPGELDAESQAQCYQAFFDAWLKHASWMQGAFWWNWPASLPDVTGTDYSPREKAAEAVLAANFELPAELARARRVEELRRRVQSGDYEVDPLDLSRALVRRHLR